MFLTLLGCSRFEPIPLDSGDPPTDPCEGAVYVAQAGYDTEDRVLADADAPEFGSLLPDPFQVHLSWALDPASSMSVIWRTDADTLASQVQFGRGEDYGSTATGRSFFIADTSAFGRVHEAHMCGLEPATTYHYRVGGEGHWSEARTFTTAPSAGDEATFRFAVAGDTREAPETWAAILDAAEAYAPDFWLFTADAVGIGSDMVAWQAWFEAAEGHFDQRAVVMVHGNHESHWQAYYALFAQPGNEQWFAFDYANAHFNVLNDTVAQSGDLEVQAAWLAEDLAASAQRWRFAAHHQPMYSSCEVHGSNITLRSWWAPVEETGGVAIDFAGHNHNYERSSPLRGGVVVDSAVGTTHVVAAGGGAPLYGNVMAEPFTEVAAVTEHFVIVEVDGATLRLVAYNLAGNVIDDFEMSR